MTKESHERAGKILTNIEKITNGMSKYLSGEEKMEPRAALWYCENYSNFIEPEVKELVSKLVIDSARRKIMQLRTELKTL